MMPFIPTNNPAARPHNDKNERILYKYNKNKNKWNSLIKAYNNQQGCHSFWQGVENSILFKLKPC